MDAETLMTPQLQAVGERAYFEVTKYKSATADCSSVVNAIGEAILRASKGYGVIIQVEGAK